MPSRSRGRFLLFVPPLSAVGVVLLGVVSGGVRPTRSARVYSGPTQGVTELSLRVELDERDRVVEVPVPNESFSVVAVEGGQRVATARGRTSALGSAELLLHLPRPRDSALELWVEPQGQATTSLGRALVLGRTDAFRAAASQRGGFQGGRRSGDIELSVAPAHGVLVTAQGALDDELVFRAERAGNAAAGALVDVKLEGAEPASARVVTDAHGLARLTVRPNEPAVRVELAASEAGSAKDGAHGGLVTRLEVVQGGIRVTRREDRLVLESAGAAATAYLGFFDQKQRYLGAQAPLTLAPDGHLVGELPWPAGLTASPLWVVASSQPDLNSPSAVGWPIVGSPEPDPKTFDARELLLLDGAPLARRREEGRARRVRLLTAGYATLALFITLFLFVRRVKDSERAIEEHLASSGLEQEAQSIVPARKGRPILAAACIGLGFIVLALFALLKDF